MAQQPDLAVNVCGLPCGADLHGKKRVFVEDSGDGEGEEPLFCVRFEFYHF